MLEFIKRILGLNTEKEEGLSFYEESLLKEEFKESLLENISKQIFMSAWVFDRKTKEYCVFYDYKKLEINEGNRYIIVDASYLCFSSVSGQDYIVQKDVKKHKFREDKSSDLKEDIGESIHRYSSINSDQLKFEISTVDALFSNKEKEDDLIFTLGRFGNFRYKELYVKVSEWKDEGFYSYKATDMNLESITDSLSDLIETFKKEQDKLYYIAA